ncbi:MAG: ABC transporter substrate-binding protein [Methanomassiliicoccales archaeon]
MKFQRAIVTLMVLALLTIAIPVATQADTANGSAISMTDSRGVITNLTGPAVHVASFGAFATNTLVDIGMLDKAVIFDATSEFNKSAIPEMQGMPADRFVTVSSSNKDMVVQKMLDLVDDGKWNKSSDVVLGYGYSYLSTVWAALEGYDFNVVTFYPNSYNGIVQVVQDIENLTGANHSVSAQMTFVKEYIADTLEDNGIDNDTERVTAIYASYSSETLKIGNNGSVTVDFINYAGGLNLGEDPEKTLPTYSADFSAILQLNPEFVLVDGYYSGTADDFKAMINDDDVVVYKLNKSWNSYCPDATEGLWTVACLFYPDYFEGELPVDIGDVEEEQDNTMIYAVVGVVIVVVAIAAVLLLRKKD